MTVPAVAGIAVLLAGVPAAAPAWAHSRLLGTDPADGATVTRQVAAVRLTFDELVRADLSTVVVEGADQRRYGDGPVRVVDHEMSQPVHPLRSGDYRVAWRAISADGHPVQGEFRFTVALPPGQEPAEPVQPAQPAEADRADATATTPAGPDGRWWCAGGAVALVVAAAGLIRVRHRRAVRAR
ncbi:copper resistance protein CopC [Micromonospora sp. NPDC050417]|uniref:copper resistance protein CopC n=1 Tax=Micromonospora sp. NPDC050417 TaxID=3364280 RepID=UPI0037AD6454